MTTVRINIHVDVETYYELKRQNMNISKTANILLKNYVALPKENLLNEDEEQLKSEINLKLVELARARELLEMIKKSGKKNINDYLAKIIEKERMEEWQ